MRAPRYRGISALERLSREDLPFVLEEFCAWHNSQSVVDAANHAVAELCSTAMTDGASDLLPVSVQAISLRLGIDIHGALPPTKKTSFQLPYLAAERYRAGGAKLTFRNKRAVIEVNDQHFTRARLSVAHELGHFLIHQRGETMDWVTLHADSTTEEEALAEYIGRMILLPNKIVTESIKQSVEPLDILELASKACVSIHAACARVLDPVSRNKKVRACVLWRMRNSVPASIDDLGSAFSPNWYVCPGWHIPVAKCHLRRNSVLARIAGHPSDAQDSSVEDVSIGSFEGRYLVKGFAWGSLENGKRKVLSFFCDPE